MTSLRLCLAVECTAKAGTQWPTTLLQAVEPILALAEAASAGGAAELALVTFGAAAPHSPAAVESVLGWISSVQHFRRLLDSLEFVGGGGRQPVALAEALAEAAALFAVAGAAGSGGGPWQQHCLVCLASEPAVQPVAWPFPEDCCMARLPGMATSLELAYALGRRGVQLGFVGGDMASNQLMLLHLANCVSEAPLSSAGLRQDQLSGRPDGALQRMRRCMLVLPGRGMAFLPFWPEASQAVQKLGAKPFGMDARMGSMEPAAPDTEDAAARPGRSDSAAAAAAVAAAAVAAAKQEAPQWTPPTAGQPTPPVAAGATPPTVDASPGSFWDVLNAEILSPDQTDGMAGMDMTGMAGMAGMPASSASVQQQAKPEPTVQGLPLPPGAAQAAQAAQQLVAPELVQQGSGNYLVHTTRVVADQKVMGSGTLMLGVGSVHGLLQDASALQAISWPPELHIAKTLARASAQTFLQSKRSTCLVTRLKIQYSSPEAEAFPNTLLAQGAAGAVTMFNGMIGVLLPDRNPITQQVLLQLVLVPQ